MHNGWKTTSTSWKRKIGAHEDWRKLPCVSGPRPARCEASFSGLVHSHGAAGGAAVLGPLACRQGSGRRSLNPALTGALNAAKEVLRDLGGKPMSADFAGMPLHVTVSDGEGTGSVAVAWWQPRTRAWRTRIVQAEVPTQWTKHLNASGHSITQIEACGPLLAFRTWPNLRNGFWIHFVDDEGAKFSTISGASSVLSLSAITHTIWKEARDRRLYAWIERVATADDPADKASRRDLRDHYDENWVVDKPPRSWSECLWERSLVPSGWVVTGSAYPLAQR